jgi:hypothetical protein
MLVGRQTILGSRLAVEPSARHTAINCSGHREARFTYFGAALRGFVSPFFFSLAELRNKLL